MQALVKVVTVYRDNDEVNYAKPGENLRIRISGVEEEDISSGFVLSSVSKYPILYFYPSMVFEIFAFSRSCCPSSGELNHVHFICR